MLAESTRRGSRRHQLRFEVARDTSAAGPTRSCSCPPDGLLQVPGPGQADLVKGFLTYTTSAEGQEAAAQAAGSAPLSEQLRSQISPAISGISAA